MKATGILAALIAIGIGLVEAPKRTNAGEASAPTVVESIPKNGAEEVDPMLGEIRVTFNQTMRNGSWSWLKDAGGQFPEIVGQPSFTADKKTCVLKVRLQPGTSYVLWANRDNFRNFQSAGGAPATPFRLAFKTAGKPSGKTLTEEMRAKAFDHMWEQMDREYSYFFLRTNATWTHLRGEFRPKALAAATEAEFLEVLRRMLAPLQDLHVWIKIPHGTIATHESAAKVNFNFDALKPTLEGVQKCGEFAVVGRTKADVFGYVFVANQGAATGESTRSAVEAVQRLSDAPGFIVDLRNATGGDESLARQLAGQFCARDVIYALSKSRSGTTNHTEFGPVSKRVLKASAQPFSRPVVVLLGNRCMSSGEGLAKMMKALPNVTTMGEPTRGSSGNPKQCELPGLSATVWFSTWVDMLPDGTVIEGRGIRPDVEMNLPAGAFHQADPLFQEATALLKRKTTRQ